MYYFQLNSSWASVPDSEKLYLEIIKNTEQIQNIVVLASALAKRLSANNNELLKSYIVSRVKPFIFVRKLIFLFI